MRKLLAILNPTNKYRNMLFLGSEKLLDGNSGLEELRIGWKGKRAVLELELTEFDLLIDEDRCPEEYRYTEIKAAAGDAEKIKALNTTCELLQISPVACDGCPKRPNGR